jgi:hypothetical protein
VPVIKSRIMRCAGHVARLRERRSIYGVLVEQPVGKRLLGRPGPRRAYNNKVGLQDVEFGVMDWIDLAQNRDRGRALVIGVMNIRVP